MLKCLCQKINHAALLLALLAGWAALSGCQSQPSAQQNPAPAPGQNAGPAAPANPASHVDGDDRAAESRAVAAALAAPASPVAPKISGAPTTPATPATNSDSMVLREGDSLHITFPGAPNLDDTLTIRRDGKITMKMVGEIKAAGLTPQELEQQLLKAYDNLLVDKEVTVVVQTSTFIVYVSGAVLRPGKVVSDRVETPLEVLMEAGIDHDKANLKKVVVVRENADGKTEHFKLNLDDVLKGRPAPPFTLKMMDKIYVPQKFSWY
jgi:polysaccharide export outer membrane protein